MEGMKIVAFIHYSLKGIPEAQGEPLALGAVLQSLIGALYHDKGAKAARQFVQAHVLSRAVDVESHISIYLKMKDPRSLLMHLVKRQGLPVPVAR